MDKSYLGDGVYVECDDDRTLWLTTENGIEVANRIALEPEVMRALAKYAQRRGIAPVVGDVASIEGRDAVRVVIALVAKQGGDVTLTDAELCHADRGTLTRETLPGTMAPGLRLTLRKRGA